MSTQPKPDLTDGQRVINADDMHDFFAGGQHASAVECIAGVLVEAEFGSTDPDPEREPFRNIARAILSSLAAHDPPLLVVEHSPAAAAMVAAAQMHEIDRLRDVLQAMVDRYAMHGPCRHHSCASCQAAYRAAREALREGRAMKIPRKIVMAAPWCQDRDGIPFDRPDKQEKVKRNRPEESFLKSVLQAARLLGWRSAHFRPAMTKAGNWVTAVGGDGKGFPDILLIRKRALIVAELKVPPNRTTPEQDAWLNAFRLFAEWDTCVRVFVWTPADMDRILEILR